MMRDRFKQAAATGLGGIELRVELVAEGHPFIELGDDAVLLGEGRERYQNRVENF